MWLGIDHLPTRQKALGSVPKAAKAKKKKILNF